MYGSNFTGWPIQPNHISEIVKEPLWANAESILLLPFSAQSYIHIILKIAIRGNSSPPQAVRFSCQEIHKTACLRNHTMAGFQSNHILS